MDASLSEEPRSIFDPSQWIHPEELFKDLTDISIEKFPLSGYRMVCRVKYLANGNIDPEPQLVGMTTSFTQKSEDIKSDD